MPCRVFIVCLILLTSCDELIFPLDIIVGEDAGQLCNGIVLDGGACIESETMDSEHWEHNEPESEQDRIKKWCELRKRDLDECIKLFGEEHERCIKAQREYDECIESLSDPDGLEISDTPTQ